MLPTLLSLVAPGIVIMTTSGVANDSRIGIKTRIFMIPTLSLLVAPEVVVMTPCGSLSPVTTELAS